MGCSAPWPVCSDDVIDDLVERATEAGITVVASSGNDGGPYVSSPANHPSTIAVGASTITDSRAPYSAYGAALDVVAPGGSRYDGILQETFNGAGEWAYYNWTGTSMAAATRYGNHRPDEVCESGCAGRSTPQRVDCDSGGSRERRLGQPDGIRANRRREGGRGDQVQPG